MNATAPAPKIDPTELVIVAKQMIVALSLDRMTLKNALIDLLAMWDRRDDSGWTAADVIKLDNIRKLVKGGTLEIPNIPKA